MNYSSEFRKLHTGKYPLILPNIWDAGSARIFENMGAKAVATSSAGVSWAMGYADGNSMPVELMTELTKRIVRVVRIPLSVDMEEGYSTDPNIVAENVVAIARAGAVGINIEDGAGEPAMLGQKLNRIRASLEREGIDLFINVRTDVYLQNLVPAERALAETLRRAALYKEAGADGIFIPGIRVADEIRTLVNESEMPVNVMAWPGLAPAKELAILGVKRISAGSAIPQVLWQHASILAGRYLRDGDSEAIYDGAMAYPDLQELFANRPW